MTAWIEPGQPAPDFTLPAHDGSTVSLRDLRGAPVVIYFYPKDDTPGCTREACAFRDQFALFKERNVKVLGISPDDVESHAAFHSKFDLNFQLLADIDHSVAEAFGAWRERKQYGRSFMGIQRSTFVINSAGNVAKTWKSVRVDGHEQKVLKALDDIAQAFLRD
ncbi:MAG: thioredoxin-dependent thiol peroxidase [Phycisphaerales bacterium]